MMPDIPELLSGLKAAPKILREFIVAIPEEKRMLRRGEGFWTIAEHVSHLAEVQPMLLQRFRRFMEEEQPEFVPFIPGKAGEEAEARACMDIAAALQQFAECRAQQLLLLEKSEGVCWQKTAVHPEYDQYSLAIFTRHVFMHDYWHMYRIEELWLAKDAYLTQLA